MASTSSESALRFDWAEEAGVVITVTRAEDRAGDDSVARVDATKGGIRAEEGRVVDTAEAVGEKGMAEEAAKQSGGSLRADLRSALLRLYLRFSIFRRRT